METNSFDPDVYKTAKSGRPAWANLLMLAGVALLAFLVAVFTEGWGALAWVFGAATIVLCIIAGISAIARVKR